MSLKKIRAFVAVTLPIETINAVREVQEEVRTRAAEAGLKVAWVPPNNMHVTLKFLAHIQEENVWAIRDQLQERLVGRASVPAVVRGVGAFPSRNRPRVLWVGVHTEEDALTALAADVEGWLDALGFDKEARPFHPHLTLGRVKEGAADVLEGLEEREVGDCRIHEVVLYQSVTSPKGATYTPLARIPLEG